MNKFTVQLILSSLVLTGDVQGKDAAHLFILSGQSNMAALDPSTSFTPAVQAKFGKEHVSVVKDAVGGQPIRRWYKDWKPASGDAPKGNGDLYDRLMAKVTQATKDKELASVTFLWMQGERDANERHGEVYESSLKGLFDQLQTDLKRDDINVVIGRLSDFDMKNQRYAHWTMVRDIQVKVADGHPRGAWVDTDDLNDGLNKKGRTMKNDLHYSVDGYKTFGIRLADKAIHLIGKN